MYVLLNRTTTKKHPVLTSPCKTFPLKHGIAEILHNVLMWAKQNLSPPIICGSIKKKFLNVNFDG